MSYATLVLALTVLSQSSPEIRTIYQVNSDYDPRIDLRMDAVMVHNHGGSAESTRRKITSWLNRDQAVFRMFFADSDAGRIYTRGQWDGKNHEDEAETRADGSLIECAGVRPYMIPTEGWTNYLRSLVEEGLDAGAVGIVPEEPLSHTQCGYSRADREAYEQRYREPWVAPHTSPQAFFRHSAIMSDLYLKLVTDLTAHAKQYGSKHGLDVQVFLPNHSVMSNAAGRMVFPNIAACRESGIDAFIGQVWTGPVGWSLGEYAGQRETRENGFFENAYLLYSTFENQSRGTDLPMYFLIDPVEDDPQYTWDQYHVWYEKCIAACLMCPSVSRYEVMPWPDRIFLPGHSIGGGTPGPARYRSEIMAVCRALQDMEDQEGISWIGGTTGIGVLVSDTMGWERGGPAPRNDAGKPGDWQNFHGFTLPLIKRGIRSEIVPLERLDEPAFADNFRVLLLSYNLWKPLQEKYHEALAEWMRRGGVLVFAGVPDAYDAIDMWWRPRYETPQDHLFAAAGCEPSDEPQQEHPVGKGWLLRVAQAPWQFAASPEGAEQLRGLARRACELAELEYREADYWEMRRGHYRIVYPFAGPRTVEGPFIDVFDPDIRWLKSKTLDAQQAALFYDPGAIPDNEPAVLFWSGRLLVQRRDGLQWTLRIAGPLETDGRVRIALADKHVASVTAVSSSGENLLRHCTPDETAATALVSFGFSPEGTRIEITLE